MSAGLHNGRVFREEEPLEGLLVYPDTVVKVVLRRPRNVTAYPFGYFLDLYVAEDFEAVFLRARVDEAV